MVECYIVGHLAMTGVITLERQECQGMMDMSAIQEDTMTIIYRLVVFRDANFRVIASPFQAMSGLILCSTRRLILGTLGELN